MPPLASPLITDPWATSCMLILGLLGCGPVWALVARHERTRRQLWYRDPGAYMRHVARSPLDATLVWARRAVTLLAGFYLTLAMLLTPPEFFAAADVAGGDGQPFVLFSFGELLRRDMLALKHIMHACFFWAGISAFWASGNAHALEICFAIFVLAAMPSLAAVIVSVRLAYSWGVMSNLALSCTGLMLSSVCAGLCARALYLSHASAETCRSQSPAVATTFHRYTVARAQALTRSRTATEVGKDKSSSNNSNNRFAESSNKTQDMRAYALGALWLQIAMHGISNGTTLAMAMTTSESSSVALGLEGASASISGVAPDAVATISVPSFVAGYVEALSLALHWGFVLGSGFHGVKWCSVSSLEHFTWGTLLLLVAQIMDAVLPVQGQSSEPKFPAAVLWVQVAVHACCLATALSLQNALKQANLGQESDFANTFHNVRHVGAPRRSETGAVSLWSVIACSRTSRRGSDDVMLTDLDECSRHMSCCRLPCCRGFSWKDCRPCCRDAGNIFSVYHNSSSDSDSDDEYEDAEGTGGGVVGADRRRSACRHSVRFHFFGYLAAICSTLVAVSFIGEAVLMPWIAAGDSDNICFAGGCDAFMLRAAVRGLNFSLHAAAVYYFAIYRAVRAFPVPNALSQGRTDPDATLLGGEQTLWESGLAFMMLGIVAFQQVVAVLVATAPGAVPSGLRKEHRLGLRSVLNFNVCRLVVYMVCVCAYYYFPSREAFAKSAHASGVAAPDAADQVVIESLEGDREATDREKKKHKKKNKKNIVKKKTAKAKRQKHKMPKRKRALSTRFYLNRGVGQVGEGKVTALGQNLGGLVADEQELEVQEQQQQQQRPCQAPWCLRMMWTFQFASRDTGAPDSIRHRRALAVADLRARIAFYVYIFSALWITLVLSGGNQDGWGAPNVAEGEGVAERVALAARRAAQLGEHSAAYGLIFHFCLILFGYALLGSRTTHGGYLAFASVAATFYSLVSFSSCLAVLGRHADILSFLMFLLGAVVNIRLGVACWVQLGYCKEVNHAGPRTVYPPTFLV